MTSNNAKLVFLGTGPAWRTPELGCPCVICETMRARGERRTRAALWFEGPARVLLDCGPDITDQLEASGLDKPDIILLSHEHGDHYLGLDDLEAFRRSEKTGRFDPIPTYAHELAWQTVETRFGYLLGKLLEKRTAQPGEPLQGITGDDFSIMPFNTDHGPMPRGSVGYIINYRSGAGMKKLVYTSDFKDAPDAPEEIKNPDILVTQAHWFNEPVENRPSHMSLQNLVGFVRGCNPGERVFLVHMSDQDLAEGETESDYMKKDAPLDPMRDPDTGEPFSVPRCQEEWQAATEAVFKSKGLSVPVTVAYDGLVVDI